MLLEFFGDPCEITNVRFWGTSKEKCSYPIITRRLHSELLLPEGRIDIAVLDSENLSFGMNSKGCNGGIRIHKGNHIFIEIKASRTNRSSITSKRTWMKSITNDIDKLAKYSYKSFMLCFEIQRILDEEDIEILQKHAQQKVELLYCKSKAGHSYIMGKGEEVLKVEK